MNWNKLFAIFYIITLVYWSSAQRGLLGDYTVSSEDEILNTFSALSNNAFSGENTINVTDNSLTGGVFLNELQEGDLILIYQVQGVSVDVNTTAIGWGGAYTAQNNWQDFGGSNPDWDITEYGAVLDYQSAGLYEYAEVVSTNGTQEIVLNCVLKNDYNASQHAQIVRVPRFENLIIENNASISTLEWDGSIGGVVAIEVNDNLQLTGTAEISASEKGFRGGERNNQSSLIDAPGMNQGFLGSFEPSEGAEKGESIYGFHTEYDEIYSRYCRGAIANGGGGANYHNAGGGGGSNVGVGNFTGKGVPNPGTNDEFVAAWNLENPSLLTNPSSGGGRGGYSHGATNQNPLVVGPDQAAWNGDFRRVTGGTGGHPLELDADRVFFGGGGGAGDGNDGYAGIGGRGGGAVFLQVYGNISGNGSVTANGAKGGDAAGNPPPQFSSQRTGDDGAGGGGGGGSVIIQNIEPIPSTIRLFSEGGDGGNQQVLVGTFGQMSCEGPGAGGAGGRIEFSTGNPQQSVIGGNAGVTNSSFVTNFNHNGATGGASGLDNLSIDHYDIISDTIILCTEENTTIELEIMGNLPSGEEIDWYNTPFGGTSFHTGTDYTTPIITENTTYYVGVCSGSFRAPIVIRVSPEITFSGTPVINEETCAGNDGSIIGITASGGEGNLVFEWNAVVSSSEELTQVIGGEYTLTATDENGCSATTGPYTIPPSPGPAINSNDVVIEKETCNGNDGSITGITATGDNLSYFWNGEEFSSIDLENITAGEYTLVVTDENDCEQFVGPFIVESEEGPEIDISSISITPETCSENDGGITGITATGVNLTIEWNNEEQPELDLNNINAGEYTLRVTDEDGCFTEVGPFEVELNEGPTVDTSNLIVQPEICENGQGSISGIVITSDYQDFSWSNNVTNTLNLNGLNAGNYTLTVNDVNGCSTEIGPIEVINLASPTVDTSSLIIQEESCFENDGAVTGISATGNGLTYSWNGNPSSSIDLENAEAGEYVLIITDTNDCQLAVGPFEIDFNPGPSINGNNVSITNESCLANDGSVTGLTTSGTELTYTWNGEEQSSIDLENVTAGEYSLVVEDQNGCSDTFGPLTIEQDEIPVLEVSPNYAEILAGEEVTLVANLTPENENAEINWFPEFDLSCTDCAETIASPEESTTYTAIYITEEGCEITDTAYVFVQENCPEVFVPTIFSPNGDGENDFLCVRGDCITTFTLQVFNRWGEQVFVTQNLSDCWDGTHDGETLNSGVFVFQINGEQTDGTSFKFGGNITLVR